MLRTISTCRNVLSLKFLQEKLVPLFPSNLFTERGSVSFTMSSGGQESFSFIPRWNEEAATMESFDQRVKFFTSSTKEEKRYVCGPRLLSTFDPEGDSFRCVRDNLINVQLEEADGSGALMIVKTTGLSVGLQVNSGSYSVVVGFLQTRFSSTKLW